MSQEKKNIDQLIREKLLQTEVAPPASVWTGLEKAMAKDRKAAIVLLYRRLGYAAAAVLLIGFMGYYFTLSERSIESTKNNLSHQIVVDSNAVIKDDVAVAITEGTVENETAIPETVLPIQKQIDLPILAKTEKNVNNKDEQVLIASQTLLEENPFVDVLTTSLEAIADRKPAQAIELKSLYELGPSPLNMFKAYAYKSLIENEEMFDLLAENTSKFNKQGWSLGLAFAPTSVGRFSGFSTNDYGLLYADAENGMSSIANVVSEKDLPAYSGGVNLEYHISERLSFQSGIYYLKQGQRIENFSVLENSMSASNSSNSYFGNISIENNTVLYENVQFYDNVQISDEISYSNFDAALRQQFELLEIPFVANYKVINRKIVVSVLAGLNTGILVGNNVYLTNYSKEPIGKTEELNSLIYKSVLGLSFEYPLTRKFYFSLSPTLKYQLNNFNKNAIVREELQYFEFKTGLNYRF